MVDSIGNNINIKLKGTDVQLNKNTIKGTTIDKKTPIFMKKYDKDGDGVISQKESEAILQDLKKAAGDNTLTSKEFEKAKLGSKEDYAKIASALAKKAETTTVENQDGSTTTTTRNDDGTIKQEIKNGKTRITRNYDANGNLTSASKITPDGSSATTYKYDENGNMVSRNTVKRNSKNKITGQSKEVNTYDEAGNKVGSKNVEMDKTGKIVRSTVKKMENNQDGKPVKISQTVTDSNGNCISSGKQTLEYKDGKLSSTTLTEKTKDSTVNITRNYASDGKTVLHVSQNVKNKDGSIAYTEQQHNEFGKLTEKHTIKKDANGNVTSDLTTTSQYAQDGKTIQKMETTGIKNTKPYNSVTNYDSNGNIQSIDNTYYKRGAKFEDHYDGQNLENRNGYIPSKRIAYEEDGKTIKEVTINQFDKDGVLIGQQTQDKDGKVIDSHDFSRIDGKFDTSYQKGRGDCYLLAGLNALTASEGGREALKNTITTGKDPKTGETTYTVHFPGAAKIRKNLIKQGVPEDKIDIKDSYTYTESEIHEKAKLAGSKYSAGDKDVLLLEVGYEDLRTDAKADIADLKRANPKLSDTQIESTLHVRGLNYNDENDNLRTGLGADATFMLTGKNSTEYQVKMNKNASDVPVCSIDSDMNMTITGGAYNLSAADNAKIDDIFNKIEQDCRDGKLDNYSGTVGFLITKQTVNGKTEKNGGHELSISKIEGDKVYLRNPWDPTKEIVMTRDEVKKAATSISLVNVKANGNSNPVSSIGQGTQGGGSTQISGQGSQGGGSTQISGQGSQGGGSTPVGGQGSQGGGSTPVGGQGSQGGGSTQISGQGSQGGGSTQISGQGSQGGGSTPVGGQGSQGGDSTQVGGSGNGDNTITNTPQAGSNFKVPEGKGYKTLLAEALKEQGIDPTPENIAKASEQFKAANKGAVHTYKGANKKYTGNEYLLMGAVVKIPKFEIQ